MFGHNCSVFDGEEISVFFLIIDFFSPFLIAVFVFMFNFLPWDHSLCGGFGFFLTGCRSPFTVPALLIFVVIIMDKSRIMSVLMIVNNSREFYFIFLNETI